MTSSTFAPQIDAHHWETVGPLAMSAARRAAAATGLAEAELATAVTRYLRWAWQTAGASLDDTVFDRGLIDRYIAVALTDYSSDGSRNTIRSRLLRIQEALNPASHPRPLRALGATIGTTPYREDELIELRSWAAREHSDRRRRDSAALLALGLGAGLHGGEIIATRGRDIHRTADLTAVIVHGPLTRSVPLIEPWADLLPTGLDPDAYVFAPERNVENDNLISNYVARSRTPPRQRNHARIPVRSRNMRSTWIIHHLTHGTAALELLDVAGLESFAALDRFAHALPR